MQHFAARLPYVRTKEDAFDLYNDAARLPATSTKKLLYEEASIKVRRGLNLTGIGLMSGAVPCSL